MPPSRRRAPHGARIGGQQRGGHQHERHGRKRDRILRLDADDKADKQTSGRDRNDEANSHSCRCKVQPFTDDQAHDRALRCAERDANTEFVTTLRHAVGNESVETDAGQHQREERECAEQRGIESWLNDRVRDHVVNSRNQRDRDERVRAVHRRTKRRGERLRIACRSGPQSLSNSREGAIAWG